MKGEFEKFLDDNADNIEVDYSRGFKMNKPNKQMITKIWYSISSGGDGSAGMTFMESQELAEWDQKYAFEGWAEDCSGYIEVEHTGKISISDEIKTAQSFKDDMEQYGGDLEEPERYAALLELMNG